jgi:hypothetical protein
MSTNINLPVIVGDIGVAQPTAGLVAFKTIVVSGLTGTIVVEASGDGVTFATAVTFTSGTAKQQSILVAAAAMRVNATAGAASSVEVIAEESLARSGVIPSPPPDGPGAALDITDFGPISTVFSTNHSASGLQNDGSVNIEISADGTSWATAFKSFTGNSLLTQTISARFIRAVGVGATATMAISSEESAFSSLVSPAFEVIYRPEDPAGSRANVYVTWEEAYAALQATAEFGQRYLLFDPQFSTTVDGFGFASCQIPAGAWDMTGVVWCSMGLNIGVVIEEGARFTSSDFFIIDGGPGPGGLIITYDGDGSSGFTPFDSLAMHIKGIRTRLTNTIAGAAPMISGENGFLLASLGGNVTGGVGSGNEPMLAPVIDLKGGSFFGLMLDGSIFDGVVTDSVGGGLFDVVLYTDGAFVEHGFAGDANVNFDWTSQPWGLAPGQATVDSVHRDRHLVRFLNPVVSPADSPYQADYNELVRVDTTLGPVTIMLPFATPACGERVTVVDFSGSAAPLLAVTVDAQVGEFINNPGTSDTITTAYGARTYVCDALGNWMITGRA